MNKIKIAFIKYCGLSSGGTEKFLQTIAANLNKDIFEVDYFYTESVPLIGATHKHNGTDQERRKYLIKHGVNLIEIKLDAVDLTKRTYPWVNTNFFKIFDESKYDLLQTGRGGYPEFPFTKLHKVPIVDSLHLLAGVDNQYNISRVMHITNWSRKIWERKGGDKNRSEIVYHPIEIQEVPYHSLKEELGLSRKVIFGFHQRNDPAIFSPTPLEAYKAIESNDTHFILLGGSEKYREQARLLEIKHITFLDYTADISRIYSFLSTLDVYAHGRKDGEVNSTAMAEAMYFGLPIISHKSETHNGHIECIGDAGYVADSTQGYITELKKILSNKEHLRELSENARKRFMEKYDVKTQMKLIEKIYINVLENPFPHPIRRFISTFRIRRFLIYFPIRILELAIKKIWTKKN